MFFFTKDYDHLASIKVLTSWSKSFHGRGTNNEGAAHQSVVFIPTTRVCIIAGLLNGRPCQYWWGVHHHKADDHGRVHHAHTSEGFDLDRASYLFELIAAELLNKFGLLIMAGLLITQHAGRLITVELIIMEVLLIVSWVLIISWLLIRARLLILVALLIMTELLIISGLQIMARLHSAHPGQAVHHNYAAHLGGASDYGGVAFYPT